MGQRNVSTVTFGIGRVWHCSVDVAYPRLSDWTRLQWVLRSLIFGLRHSDFLEVGRKIEIHNDGLLGEGKTKSFYLDVGRITGSFHVPLGTLGANISS